MVADETIHPKSMTNADIGARVERLESQQDRLTAKVDAMALDVARIRSDQNHMTQLITTQYQAITAEVALVRSRYHEAMNFIQASASEAQATPAGRQVLQDISDLKTSLKDNADEVASIKGTVLKASGALAALMVLASVFGPTILRALANLGL